MKRLSMLSANFLISLAREDGQFSEAKAKYAQEEVWPMLANFLKYVWEHKEDENLYPLPKVTKSNQQ